MPSLATARSSADVPEVLDLEACGIAFDLPGKAEEGEVVGGRIRSAAIQREAAGFRGFFIVFGDFAVRLRAEIRQQFVLVAELDRHRRVRGYLARGLHQFLDQDVDVGGVVLQIVCGREKRFVRGAEILDRQDDELSGGFGLERAPVGGVDDRRLDGSLEQRVAANLGTRDIADVAELDAVVFRHQQHDRLGAGTARLHGDFLPVEILPLLVEFAVDHGKEAQRRYLREDTDRHAHFLDQSIGRADANIGLAADNGLGCQILVIENDELDIHAAFLGALYRGECLDGFYTRKVAECDAHVTCVRGRQGHCTCQGRSKSGSKDGTSGDAGHCHSSRFL